MSKTNDTLSIATFEDHPTLSDGELHAVTGGVDGIPGESQHDIHKDWVEIYPPSPPTPGGAWNACLGAFGDTPQAA